MDRSLDDAFAAVPRADFLPPDQRASAHQDRPLAIGFGATNSQPWTVRYMLRLLDARPGDRVLDVGSGSGWTAALLGWLVGEAGEVVGVDIVPELVAMAREHLAGRFGWVRFELARRGKLGWPDGAVGPDPGLGGRLGRAPGARRPARPGRAHGGSRRARHVGRRQGRCGCRHPTHHRRPVQLRAPALTQMGIFSL